MLKRIKYVSRFRRGLTHADLQRIGEQSGRNNEREGITGLLMTEGGVFLQIVEGPPDAVDRLYERILADDRHRDVVLIASEEGAERLFPGWTMRVIDLKSGDPRTEPLRALFDAVVATRGLLDSLTRNLERAVWTEFTGPPAGRPAAGRRARPARSAGTQG